MDLSIIDRAARVTWRGRHWTDWAMGVYYAGWVILGASTPITDPPFTAFAITSAVLGAASLAALAARARRTEVVLVIALTVLTLAQAAALLTMLTVGSPVATVAAAVIPHELSEAVALICVAGYRHRETLLSDLRARRDAGE